MLYWKSYPALACAGAYVQGLCVAMFCYVQGLCAARFFRLLNMGPYGPMWAHIWDFPGEKTPFLPKKKPLREHPPARARFYIYIYIYIYISLYILLILLLLCAAMCRVTLWWVTLSITYSNSYYEFLLTPLGAWSAPVVVFFTFPSVFAHLGYHPSIRMIIQAIRMISPIILIILYSCTSLYIVLIFFVYFHLNVTSSGSSSGSAVGSGSSSAMFSSSAQARLRLLLCFRP